MGTVYADSLETAATLNIRTWNIYMDLLKDESIDRMITSA